jgi:hypothetical protein
MPSDNGGAGRGVVEFEKYMFMNCCNAVLLWMLAGYQLYGSYGTVSVSSVAHHVSVLLGFHVNITAKHCNFV